MKKMLILSISLAFLMGCADEQETPPMPPTSTEAVTTGTKVDVNSPVAKALYTQKLALVEADVRTFDQQLKVGTQIEMNQAASNVLMKWDSLLNELYTVLKVQLSPEELGQLKAEQTAWVEKRDHAAESATVEFAGDSLEAYGLAVSMAKSTQARTYELVEKYLD